MNGLCLSLVALQRRHEYDAHCLRCFSQYKCNNTFVQQWISFQFHYSIAQNKCKCEIMAPCHAAVGSPSHLHVWRDRKHFWGKGKPLALISLLPYRDNVELRAHKTSAACWRHQCCMLTIKGVGVVSSKLLFWGGREFLPNDLCSTEWNVAIRSPSYRVRNFIEGRGRGLGRLVYFVRVW